MANSTDDKKPTGAAGLGNYFEAMQNQMGSLPNMHSRIMQEMVTFNTEALEFVQKRVAQDIETSTKLMACKTPEDATNVVREFYDQAFKTYSEQAQHLMEMTRSMAQGAAADSADAKPAKGGKSK
tara:strand:+ start:630 stop:1004 length:375 start_codon:yes stop_codon:yes gene_type:complete